MSDPAASLPASVLFACNMNRVRSPMAAALLQRRLGGRVFVDSCGLQEGEGIDPFVVAVMAEVGVDLSDQAPKTFGALAPDSFDLIISLTPEAHAQAVALARGRAVEVELWPTNDPTVEGGSRAQRLEAYRRIRDDIGQRISTRFG